jgi:iron complex outermembrane receptor protein
LALAERNHDFFWDSGRVFPDLSPTFTSDVEINDERVEREYIGWFPSGGITLKANEKNTMQLTGSRRIDRPDYQQLNPFEFKLDELTFQKGNPFLTPQYTNSVQLTHTYKYTLTTSLQYSYTSDFFTDIFDTLNTTASFKSSGNNSEQEIIALDVSYPFAIGKKISAYGKLTGTRQTSYLHLKGTDYENTVYIGFGYLQLQYTISPKLTAEISGWASTPSVWSGYWQIGSMGSVGVGLQAKVLKERGTLKVNFNDLFFTEGWRMKGEVDYLRMDGYGNDESRRVALSFTYLIGNSQVKQLRQRVTGSKEATDRIE